MPAPGFCRSSCPDVRILLPHRHQVLYDDGERAFEVLPAETVKWVLRPGQEHTVNGVRVARLPAAARRRAMQAEVRQTAVYSFILLSWHLECCHVQQACFPLLP